MTESSHSPRHEFVGIRLEHDRLVARFEQRDPFDARCIPKCAGPWSPMSDTEVPHPDPVVHAELMHRAREEFARHDSRAVVDRFNRGEHLHRCARTQHSMYRRAA